MSGQTRATRLRADHGPRTGPLHGTGTRSGRELQLDRTPHPPRGSGGRGHHRIGRRPGRVLGERQAGGGTCRRWLRLLGRRDHAAGAQQFCLEPGGAALASTADIPVGGGTVFKEQEVVVTQPAPGEFKAFSAICTHRGCTVGDVTGGTINCPCHGSKFKISDGSVANGPATQPLAEAKVTVSGNSIALG